MNTFLLILWLFVGFSAAVNVILTIVRMAVGYDPDGTTFAEIVTSLALLSVSIFALGGVK